MGKRVELLADFATRASYSSGLRAMEVLIVDDQTAVRSALQVLFELHDFECLSASSPEEALRLIRCSDVGVVVQDMNFSKETTSGEEGVALFRAIQQLDSELPVILLTAWTSLETAVALIKERAHDYLGKPWDDDKLIASVRSAMRLRQATQDNRRMRADDRRVRDELFRRFDLRGFVYRSRRMHELLVLATRVAASDVPILISGANGAGKERIADIVVIFLSRRAGTAR